MNGETVRFTVDISKDITIVSERKSDFSFDMEVLLDVLPNVFVNRSQAFKVVF